MTNISIKDIEITDDSKVKDKDTLIQQLLDIDLICYDDLSEEDTGSVSYWKEVNKYSFLQIAYFKNEVIGCINIHKFSDEGIKQLSLGLNKDGKMLDCLDRSDSKNVDLYIGSVVVLPEFRKIGVASRLFDRCVERIKKDYNIKGLYATIWNELGKKFFSKFSTEVVAHDYLGHDIIKLTLAKPKYTLEEMVDVMKQDENNQHSELDWGNDVGEEILES